LDSVMAEENQQLELESKEVETKADDGESTKLFVGQVPRQMTEPELRKLFEPFGTIQEIIILRDRITNTHKGCAFVTYTNRGAGEKEIQALNNKHTLHPTKRPMQVKFAGGDQETTGGDVKLFVGMLSRTSTDAQVSELFGAYGTVKEVYVMKDGQRSKGCAFVKFESRIAAQKAIVGLHDVYQDEGAPRKLIVKYADTKQERMQRTMVKQIQLNPAALRAGLSGGFPQQQQSLGDVGYYGGPRQQQQDQSGLMGPNPYSPAPQFYGRMMGMGVPMSPFNQQQSRGPHGANLFIYNVPETFTDNDLYSMFSNFGNVLSANIFRDKLTGASRGFGFVSYDHPSCAEKAIAALNGFHIGTKRLKVMLKSAPGEKDGGGGLTSSSLSQTRGFTPY